MLPDKLKGLYRRAAPIGLGRYTNVVEAAYWAKLIRRFSGTAVYELQSSPGNRITSAFSPTGFVFFLLWSSLHLYCVYVTIDEDQSILRVLYETKLRRYGDDLERVTSLVYVSVLMFLTPFKLSGDRSVMQHIVDIDAIIETSGDTVDYDDISRTSLRVTLAQILVYIVRLVCLNVAFTANVVIPVENIFQVVYSDALALVMTSLYCYYMSIVRSRFKWINKTLSEIKRNNRWAYRILVRGEVPTAADADAVTAAEHRTRERIRRCARVYGGLFAVCERINRMFGLALLFTVMHYFKYIILYLFYFMEATASGLFHDLERYLDFLVYTFWEIAIAIGIIFLIVVLSESTVAEAKNISSIIHQIINEDLSSTINIEAMQMSVQLVHEAPVFSVCGLFTLDYAFLQQGARAVSTYLVILLQFVTESTSTL